MISYPELMYEVAIFHPFGIIFLMELVLPVWTFFENRSIEETDVLTDQDERRSEEHDGSVCCATCNYVITKNDQRIAVQGAHTHEFTNPHGIRFRIGCFRQAPGCVHVGEATQDWTWFRGYDWCLANCASCFSHLGWHYLNDAQNGFYGLILSRLREAR